MASMTAERAAVVIQHDRIADFAANRYGGLHAGVPVLMVATTVALATCLAAAVMAPFLVKPMIVIMTVLLIAAAGFAFFSMFAGGEVVEAHFDEDKEVARLLLRGPTAHTDKIIPLKSIADARMTMRYRADGGKERIPMIELDNGQQIVLPSATTWQDIESIRAMLTQDDDDSAAAAAWARKANERQVVQGRGRKPGSFGRS